MDDSDRRSLAWENAINAAGTAAVFARRARRYRRLTLIRDFAGLAVPIISAYLLGAELYDPLKPYKSAGLGALGIAVVFQTLMVLWSLLAHWDEELGYCIHAISESYSLKEGWKKIGQTDVVNLELEYDLLSARQAVADSKDIEKGLTDKEKRRGMRAGLIEFNRACSGLKCKELPRCNGLPWYVKKHCIICGGN